MLLRVEDTDKERSTPEAEALLFDALNWMGIAYDPEGDEGFMRQSTRKDRHLAVVEEWLAAGVAYKSDRATGQYGGGEKSGGEAIWLKTTPEDLAFDDAILGTQTQPAKQLQDFVIVRSTGEPMFILANVIDDHDMAVTHVLRGADHKTNTFRQLLLYRALGVSPPRFGHMPLIVDKQGKKLSKRENDPSSIIYLNEFRERGYLPEALFNFLALLGWSPKPELGPDGAEVFREKMSREELAGAFGLDRVSASPAQFDTVKLGSMNYDYIVDRLNAEPAGLIAHLEDDVRAEGLDAERFDESQYEKLIREAAQRAQTLKELIEQSRFFFADRVEVDASHKTVRKVFKKADVWERLEASVARLEAIPDAAWTRERIESDIKALADEIADGKMGDIAQPLRILATGSAASPAIDITLELIGRERTLARLKDEANRAALRA
jgi:glutamyl-tRNA synthetase